MTEALNDSAATKQRENQNQKTVTTTSMKESKSMTKDPICGMAVDEANFAARAMEELKP